MCMLLSGMRGNHLTRYPKPIGVYLDDFISALDLIEEQVSTISVPLSYSEELYALRLHRCRHLKLPTGHRFEEVWRRFLSGFDDAAYARIEVDQEQGLIPKFDACSIQNALRALYLTHY
jgi:hypothetical protein